MIPDSGNADQFLRVFNRLVDRKLARLRPRMATVDDTDNRGNPYLRLWDEDDDAGRPPKVGRARTAGTEYRKGNKVIVHEVDGGDYVVLGKVVGGDDDEPDAERVITSRMLQENAVDARALAPGAVTTAALATDFRVGAANIDFSAVSTAHLAPEVTSQIAALQTAVGGIGGTTGSLEQRIAALEARMNALPNFGGYATNIYVGAVRSEAQQAAQNLQRQITNVNDELDKHKKRQNH